LTEVVETEYSQTQSQQREKLRITLERTTAALTSLMVVCHLESNPSDCAACPAAAMCRATFAPIGITMQIV
jgi:hypothetical protein